MPLLEKQNNNKKMYRWVEEFILSMSSILPFKKKIPDHWFRAALYLFSPKHAHPKSLTVARVRKECSPCKGWWQTSTCRAHPPSWPPHVPCNLPLLFAHRASHEHNGFEHSMALHSYICCIEDSGHVEVQRVFNKQKQDNRSNLIFTIST